MALLEDDKCHLVRNAEVVVLSAGCLAVPRKGVSYRSIMRRPIPAARRCCCRPGSSAQETPATGMRMQGG